MRFKFFMLAVLLLSFAPAFTILSVGQNPTPIPRIGPVNPPDPPEEEQRVKLEKDMAKKANRERQVQLQRDTDNLLKLANELKQSVDKSNENTLSLDVVKKAEEIEKLAHSVKEKMKAN